MTGSGILHEENFAAQRLLVQPGLTFPQRQMAPPLITAQKLRNSGIDFDGGKLTSGDQTR